MKQPRLRAWRLARAARRAEHQTPPSPAASDLPAIAATADDLEEIKKAVEDAASVSGGLWLSYLFVLSYIAIAAGAVTHEDLLLVRAVKLPFLNVELPLLAFFALAPFVVLITHAYALMHFIMLGKKASRFHNELRRQFPDQQTETQKSATAPDGAPKEIRDKLRRLLPSNIFVQILAGPPELRTGFFGFVLKLIALTTLVIFPVLVLLLLQIQFLPFHDLTITWAQRVALILDIVLLWLLRPPVLADLSLATFGRARVLARVLRGFGLVLAGVMSIVALLFSTVVATTPEELQETVLAALDSPRWRSDDAKFGEEETKLVSTHDLLFAGEVDPTTRRRKSLFSNTLILPSFNLYEALKVDYPKKLAWKEHLVDLRGRHLEEAVLDGADLTKADLYGALLQGASFDDAQLQGALFDRADLQGASLKGAHLQGASIFWALLEGASFDEAHLQGAALVGAQLQGASLEKAQLQGVSLEHAQLQGASLVGAHLQGAWLRWAQLQGASLEGAEVNAANFSGVFLWRTSWSDIGLAKLGAVQLDKELQLWKPVWQKDIISGPVLWDANAYAELRRLVNFIPEGEMRNDALERIETLDCANANETLASCDPAAAPPPDWQKKLAAAGADDVAYAKALATELRSLVCASDANAIHILRGVAHGVLVPDRLTSPAAKPLRSWISS
jgi:Pentapeptide repeats (8 copies)